MNLTKRDKEHLLMLIGRNPHTILQALSSEYCEREEKDFKENYGFGFKRAISLLRKVQEQL